MKIRTNVIYPILTVFGFLSAFVVIVLFFIWVSNGDNNSKEQQCIDSGGTLLYEKETIYRGFPPGSWTNYKFSGCDYGN